MFSLESRYREILDQINNASSHSSGREQVTLIAVSKKQPVEAIEALYRLGHRDFGENYAQELCEKAVELDRRNCRGIRWHFIGHLQTNKIKSLIPHLYCIHTVDSLKVAQELGKRWANAGCPGKLPIFVEVNLDQEQSKAGIAVSELPTLIQQVSEISELSLQGLMCIPDPDGDPGERFLQLRALENQFHPLSQGKLSMGMSSDFELAIREGATHVRVGTALFGERK